MIIRPLGAVVTSIGVACCMTKTSPCTVAGKAASCVCNVLIVLVRLTILLLSTAYFGTVLLGRLSMSVS